VRVLTVLFVFTGYFQAFLAVNIEFISAGRADKHDLYVNGKRHGTTSVINSTAKSVVVIETTPNTEIFLEVR
jgi:hypothetical protein